MRHNFKQHKYNAIPTKVDGIRFDSKKEATRYSELKLLEKARDIVTFLRQPSFDVPRINPTERYRADFLIFWTDGRVTIEDVKGMKTPAYKRKKKAVERDYAPIKIEEV